MKNVNEKGCYEFEIFIFIFIFIAPISNLITSLVQECNYRPDFIIKTTIDFLFVAMPLVLHYHSWHWCMISTMCHARKRHHYYYQYYSTSKTKQARRRTGGGAIFFSSSTRKDTPFISKGQQLTLTIFIWERLPHHSFQTLPY